MNISRDTFNKLKHYVGVRLQQGVPLVDADWNEQEDIRRYELQAFLRWFVGNGIPRGNDGFRILPVTDEWNDFIIKGGDGTAEGAGRCLVEGWDVINESNLNYTVQPLYKNETLATKWGVAKLNELEKPTGAGNRNDTVYLDVWEREVDSEEDTDLFNPTIGVETCVRLKREWVVRVAEGKSENELPDAPKGHIYYPLAMLTRASGSARIEADDITDLRSTDVHLASAPSATGVVVFPEFTHSKRNISDSINPGLGPGAISVRLGRDRGDDGIFVGDSLASDIFNLDQVLMGALIDSKSGTFTVGIEVPDLKTPSIRVRWWAFKPRQDLGEVIILPGIHVTIAPKTVTLDQGANRQFTANVTGTTNKAVTWGVRESGGGGVSYKGRYTAPNAAGTYHVRATSKEDISKYAEATITVTAVSVTIGPEAATVFTGKQQQFSANVTGATNKAVTWSVEGSGGGSVNNKGLYTAPNKPGTYYVRATSKEDISKYARAPITVNEVSVTIDPKTATVFIRKQQQFSANVTGMTNEAVTWSVKESGGGSVNNKGLYTAPNKPGTYHVRATSKEDISKYARATITVTAVSVTIDPEAATVFTGKQQQFSAKVTGTTNKAVTWSVQESGGGSVNNNGLYTAPNKPGTYHVKATSKADIRKSAWATITVRIKEPCPGAKPLELCTGAKPKEICIGAKPVEPCTGAKPLEFCTGAKPKEICTGAKPYVLLCTGASPQEAICTGAKPQEAICTGAKPYHIERMHKFSWDDDILGDDRERFVRYLVDDHGIEWAENAEISKSEHDRTIHLHKGENSAEIRINEVEEKATLKIGDGRTYNLEVKKEDGKLNIYKPIGIGP